MNRTAVINIVGLSDSCLGPATPRLNQFISRNAKSHITPAFPAVTCTAQSNYLTGRTPAKHGIVGNGWYHRELAEVQFWKQSNHVVHGRKIWDDLRAQDPGFTCAKLFWWYNMYSTADYSITPRPMYPADGRKVFDIYTQPFSIRFEIKKELGEFPFPAFWGPAAGAKSKFAPDEVSKWIAGSAKWIEQKYRPTLSLIYLPHLDYNLQRLGPNHSQIQDDYGRIDAIAGDLIAFFESRGVQSVILSEYGISAVSNPLHLNRLFREKGWLTIKDELGLELLDCGASKAFAVADHQIAHIYVNDLSILNQVRDTVGKINGVEQILGLEDKKKFGIDHERAGDLIAIAGERSWFTYYYWEDDTKAPDFARTVDIHRKPGYDPVELFIDPKINLPLAKVALKLLRKKLGFRVLMDVIPLDATLVRGSHGRLPSSTKEYPILVAPKKLLPDKAIDSTAIYSTLKNAILNS
ncbi:MAG TPA: nucleotide pyrophosphatase/phosphodiesterase family protein [Verrucomicrobiae bacterium]|nr:nucleotide pyrophosphatase/phosphodiesterase family protein [Verrucomicrobiae bacterium]